MSDMELYYKGLIDILRDKLTQWESDKSKDSDTIMKWFSDIKNNGGIVPKSNVDLDIVLKELREILR